jgi:hypothetical protein
MLKIKIESHLSYLGLLGFWVNLAGHPSLTKSIVSLGFFIWDPDKALGYPDLGPSRVCNYDYRCCLKVDRTYEHSQSPNIYFQFSVLCMLWRRTGLRPKKKGPIISSLDTLLFLTHCCYRSFPKSSILLINFGKNKRRILPDFLCRCLDD